MKNNNFYKLDLLKRRKKEAGFDTLYLKSNKATIIKGSLIGGVFILFISGLCIMNIVEYNSYNRERKKLQSEVSQHEQLTSKIQAQLINIKAVEDFNTTIIANILGLRSGSAFLTELSNIVPKGMILNNLDIKGNRITINGQANDINGLKLINSFMIKLEESPFIDSTKVDLKMIDTDQSESNAVVFELSSIFSNKMEEINMNLLDSLGSLGLSKRIQILKDAGLI